MNERVMQFRIGMFVIVAGLVLTMLIVWFGESPALLRDQVYLKAHYAEAPGVLEGVAVRKSGIRIGEVVAIEFDQRPNLPDGVIVTLAIDPKYSIREGSVPRLSRSLIGDVTIDLLPGAGQTNLKLSHTAAAAPIIEGEVAADPSKALAAATIAFEKAGDTLQTINDAASGLSKLSRNAERLDDFLKTWTTTGTNVSAASQSIDSFVKTNGDDFRATMANFKKLSEKLNDTLSPETQDSLKTGIARFSSASARMDAELADAAPLLKDLGASVKHTPTTDFGQSVRRFNRVAADIELLTATLRNRNGTLNTDGSIQKLLTQPDVHDNFNNMALSASQAFNQLKAVLSSFRAFAERVSRDPSAISRGMLSR
ncbi:MAG: MCE family protein [Planctomycetaceae bacterium]|nr:MCE family protein [Planctomycetaceae bacterium]